MRQAGLLAIALAVTPVSSSCRSTTETFVSLPPGTFPGGAPKVPAVSTPYVRRVQREAVTSDGGTLLVLDGRGLEVIDLSMIGNPVRLARVAVSGKPAGLELRGSLAYVVVADSVAWAWAEDLQAVVPSGASQLLVVDVADSAVPKVRARLPIDGRVVASHMFGDILQVVAFRYGWWDYAHPSAAGLVDAGTSPHDAYVATVDLSDPAMPRAVARVGVSFQTPDPSVDFTPGRTTVAQRVEDAGTWATHLEVFDTSDPGGAIVRGARFDAPGQLRAMSFDPDGGVFGAWLSYDPSKSSSPAGLRFWRSPSPDIVTPAGTFEMGRELGGFFGGAAALFDGARVFVTADAPPRLLVVNAADPASPVQAGELAMPFAISAMSLDADRLVAWGYSGCSVGLALVDVASAAHVALLAKLGVGALCESGNVPLRFGPLRTWHNAGLITVPTSSANVLLGLESGSLNVVGYGREGLSNRGTINGLRGDISAFPLPDQVGQLGVFVQGQLRFVDASDPNAFSERARVDLAPSVNDLAFSGDQSVQLVEDWRVRLVQPPDLDPPVPLASIELDREADRLFQVDEVAWPLCRGSEGYAGKTWVSTWLQAVDFSVQANPRLLGGHFHLGLDEIILLSVPSGRNHLWGAGLDAAQMGTTLALSRQRDYAAGQRPRNVLVLDLAHPDAPGLARVELPGASWAWGLREVAGSLWITEFDWDSGDSGLSKRGRYFVDRIDVSDPSQPRIVARYNVPGVFVGAEPQGGRIYTLDVIGQSSTDGIELPTSVLNALDLTAAGTARLVASVVVAGRPTGVEFASGRGYLTTFIAPTRPGTLGTSTLAAIDLQAMKVRSVQTIAGAWASLFAAVRGKLFVQSASVLVFDLIDPDRPSFERSIPSTAPVSTVAVVGDSAYLPTGINGVASVPLAP